MGRRSRKGRRVARTTPRPTPEPAAPTRRERNLARDDATRAGLAPLAPGERPLSLTISAVVAALIGVGNLVAFLAGLRVQDEKPALGGILVLTVLMGACAYGLWRARYWAVLGFEVLLAVTAVVAAISLAVASNLAAVALCLALLGLTGTLFWKLVRIMARVQLPRRSTPASGALPTGRRRGCSRGSRPPPARRGGPCSTSSTPRAYRSGSCAPPRARTASRSSRSNGRSPGRANG